MAQARTRRSFDEQASSFDRRAGLPEASCATIAREILGLIHPAPGDLLLEVGAGTGQIGYHLCGGPARYVGFDAAAGMLDAFAERCRDGGRSASLVHADGGRRWPVDDAGARAIFGSRALHLLPLEHIVDEVFRVAAPDRAALLIGRVQRAPESLRSRMRREMHEGLRRLGVPVAEGRGHERRVLEACVARGGAPIEPRIVASWRVASSPAAVLESWRHKSALGGVEVTDDVREAVLAPLAEWAKDTFGALDATHEAEEQYALTGVWLHGGTTDDT